MIDSKSECGCPKNSAGDIRCHVCGEYVNVQCWACHTLRGDGVCPNPVGKVDHREFLYMGIGWELMDLRQDIEAGNMFFGGYDWKDTVERLARIERAVADYADEHFPVVSAAL